MIYDELVLELGFNPDQLAPRLLPPFDKAAVLRARPRQYEPPTIPPPPPRRPRPAMGVAPEPMRLIGITGTHTIARAGARTTAATDTGKGRSGLFSALTGAWTTRTLMRRHA